MTRLVPRDGGLCTWIRSGATQQRARADSEVATFTKWMVGEGPGMAGVVGGAVGEGAYVGKVLDFNPGPTTVIAAIYQVDGSERPFTALVHVEQTGLHAVIPGAVTDGWGKGNLRRLSWRIVRRISIHSAV